MNYQQLHQNSLANRRVRKEVSPSVKLTLAELGKIIQGRPKEGAQKHLDNMLETWYNHPGRTAIVLSSAWKDLAGLERKIKRHAQNWKLDLPAELKY